EVKGHVKALDTCIFMAKSKYPFTEHTLKKLNENLLSALWKFDEYYTTYKEQNQQLGAYKSINNSIKYTLDGSEGQIEPTSNTNTVDTNMQKIWKENEGITDFLEKCAHLAYQIWINQPFPDGNKRTARLSVSYLLISLGLPLISFKAEGYHFNEGLLRSHQEKTLLPIMSVIAKEVKQQLSEIMEMDKKLKIDRQPPKLGLGSTLIF
ncbi:MAG: Fic family protein, partial [Cytophagales bacterium]